MFQKRKNFEEINDDSAEKESPKLNRRNVPESLTQGNSPTIRGHEDQSATSNYQTPNKLSMNTTGMREYE